MTFNDKKYQEFEKNVEKAKKHNNELLLKFENYLKEKSLTAKTIHKHISNIDFFANTYLLYYDVITIEKGISNIGSFLGYFFIEKTTWASKATILENITSFKKFYTFLNEIGKITEEDLNEMKNTIKEEKNDWINNVNKYLNGESLYDDWL